MAAMGRGKRIESVLSQLPEPTATQVIVRVTGRPGGNLLQVEDASGSSFMCRVPAKFRNRVWVIIGGFLIVETVDGDGESSAQEKVRGTLAHHLYRDQIRHLQELNLWPAAFATVGSTGEPRPGASSDYGAMDDELHENTNRRQYGESDDESEGDEDGEGGGEEDEEGSGIAADAEDAPQADAGTER